MNRDGIFERSAIVLVATTAATVAVFGYGHAGAADAAVIYKDAPSNDFKKNSYGSTDGWHYVKNGGFLNSSQVWSNFDESSGFDDGWYQFPGVTSIGSAQAWISNSGIMRGYATYCAGGCSDINQGLYHNAWVTVIGSQYFSGRLQINDNGVEMDFGKVGADTVRVFT